MREMFCESRSEVIKVVLVLVWNFRVVWHVVFINRYHFLKECHALNLKLEERFEVLTAVLLKVRTA